MSEYGDAARAVRMYPSMIGLATVESASPAASGKSDAQAPAGVVATAPDAAGLHKQSHPHDQAARSYPKLEQPDPVAQKIADEINGKSVELVEAIPESVKALRETNPLRHPAHYDVALGLSTKVILSGQVSAEHVVVRNAVAGMAHDMGLDSGDLNTIINTARAAKGGTAAAGEPASDLDVADAAALYVRDPRVGALLNHFNITANPTVVRILAAAARAERSRGRLR